MLLLVRMRLCLPVVYNILLAAFLAIASASTYNKSAFRGTNVTIPCDDSRPFYSADWVRPRTGDVAEKELCLNGFCPNGYARRYSVDRNNKFQLTIHNVTPSDSGSYVCIAYDDFTDHRYTTELNVIDRSPEPDIARPAATIPSLVYSSTLSAERSPLEVYSSTVVTISLVLVMTVCMTTVGVIIFIFVRRRRKKLISRNIHQLTNVAKKHASVDACNIISKIQDGDEPLQPNAKTEQMHVIECFALFRGSRMLVISFLRLFRKTYNGNNKSVSAAEAFRLLASSSLLWSYKLTEKNAAKRRIHRLLYFECSGYISPPTRLIPLKPTSVSNPVMAVAILGGRVYTISKGSDTILDGSDRGGSICVKDMKTPVDIVACAMTQSLYIADEQRCIWRVSVGGDKTAEKWKEIHSKLLPRTLSIRKGSVLVTTDTNILLKFSADDGGKVINLPVNMEPYHAVETALNTYVVCCKVGRGVQVAEVGSDGRVIRKFVCVLQLLRNPSYVVLDGEGRPLVADSVNSKILLLDLKLKYSHTVLSHERDGIVEPHRLCLDELKGQLYVVQKSGHPVELFKLKAPSELITL